MADRVCITCKYYGYELDENGEDKCTNCMLSYKNGDRVCSNWEAKEEKMMGNKLEICDKCCHHNDNACKHCSADDIPPYSGFEAKEDDEPWYFKDPKEEKTMGNKWYTEAIKEGLRQAEEKSTESGCKDEEPKKESGRYPWGNALQFRSYSGWVKEVLTNKDPLFSVEEIHPAIDLILKAALVDATNKQSEMLAMIERHLAQIARKK